MQVDPTYLTELREANDLNFVRFDAKMGERLDLFETRLHSGLAGLQATFTKQLADLESRFERRISQIELDARIEKRFSEFEARIDTQFSEFEATIDEQFATLEVRLSRRIYAVSIASFLAQIVALVTILRFMR